MLPGAKLYHSQETQVEPAQSVEGYPQWEHLREDLVHGPDKPSLICEAPSKSLRADQLPHLEHQGASLSQRHLEAPKEWV